MRKGRDISGLSLDHSRTERNVQNHRFFLAAGCRQGKDRHTEYYVPWNIQVSVMLFRYGVITLHVIGEELVSLLQVYLSVGMNLRFIIGFSAACSGTVIARMAFSGPHQRVD